MTQITNQISDEVRPAAVPGIPDGPFRRAAKPLAALLEADLSRCSRSAGSACIDCTRFGTFAGRDRRRIRAARSACLSRRQFLIPSSAAVRMD